MQYAVVQEQQGGQGLVLRRGGHTITDGQVGQERVDLPLAHLGGVALAVELDKPDNPGRVCLLGPPAVVASAKGLVHPIRQLERPRQGVRNCRVGRRILIVAAICRPKRGVHINRTACKQRQQAREDCVGVGNRPVLALRMPAAAGKGLDLRNILGAVGKAHGEPDRGAGLDPNRSYSRLTGRDGRHPARPPSRQGTLAFEDARIQ